MRALFRKLRNSRFRYEPMITILVHRDRILHNLRQFQHIRPDALVAPVLKSNAYGHGLVQVAKILEGQTLPFLCVDSYVEALVLRNEGVQTPLLIMGYTPLENIERSRLKKISFGITSLEALQKLSASRERAATIHLKIDTGMHRQGIVIDELNEALEIIANASHLTLEGVYSHLADADAPGSEHVKTQISQWNSVVSDVRKKIPDVRFFHLSNTAGMHYASQIDANVIRIGIGLYGFNTSLSKLNLLPALEMKTRITSVRRIKTGDVVGYNGIFKAPHEMTVATIPVGYAEGIDRRLSNQWTVTSGEFACPAVGRINMNMTSIDVSSLQNPHIDDEVLVVSADSSAPNSIEAMAKICDTIPYEILTGFPAQIRRTVISPASLS